MPFGIRIKDKNNRTKQWALKWMIKMYYQSGVWLTHLLTSNLKIKKKENN